jgi:hypothetical protein
VTSLLKAFLFSLVFLVPSFSHAELFSSSESELHSVKPIKKI